jgi:hypothetical protein
MLSLNNENGLAFAIDNTGAASFGKDVNFNGNNAIFGGGQNIRIGYAAINIANGSTLNWTVDNHAYDTVDTSIGHTPYGGGYGGFRYVLGGSRIDFIANGGALGFNNLDGDIGIYGNGNAGHIVMRSPVHYGDGSTGAVPAYANNAAAIAGGLTAGDTYRTGGDPDQLCIVH